MSEMNINEAKVWKVYKMTPNDGYFFGKIPTPGYKGMPGTEGHYETCSLLKGNKLYIEEGGSGMTGSSIEGSYDKDGNFTGTAHGYECGDRFGYEDVTFHI